jgi:hypothetical protein
MPTATYKVLAQSAPSATTNTDVYTVGSGKQAVVSTIAICNRAATAATYRIAIRVAGSALSNEEYIVYDVAIPGVDTITLTMGVTLGAADVVTVYASTANLSFNLFGTEIA